MELELSKFSTPTIPPMEVVVAWLRGVRLSKRAEAFIQIAIEMARDGHGTGESGE